MVLPSDGGTLDMHGVLALLHAVSNPVLQLCNYFIKIKAKSDKLPKLLVSMKSDLEVLEPLIRCIGELNLKLGLPKNELESLEISIKKGVDVVGTLLETKSGTWWSKAENTDELVQLDASIKKLLNLLKIYAVRDVKEVLVWVQHISKQANESAKVSNAILAGTQVNNDILASMAWIMVINLGVLLGSIFVAALLFFGKHRLYLNDTPDPTRLVGIFPENWALEKEKSAPSWIEHGIPLDRLALYLEDLKTMSGEGFILYETIMLLRMKVERLEDTTRRYDVHQADHPPGFPPRPDPCSLSTPGPRSSACPNVEFPDTKVVGNHADDSFLNAAHEASNDAIKEEYQEPK